MVNKILFFLLFLYFPMELYSAKIIYFKGNVEYKKNKTNEWVRVEKKIRVNNFDLIRTNSNSIARIQVIKGFIVTVQSDTIVAIKDLAYQKDKGFFPSIMLYIGEIYSKIKKGLSKEVQVHTQSAIIAVRGTEFDTKVENTGVSTIKMTKGVVSLGTYGKSNSFMKLGKGGMATIDYNLDCKIFSKKSEWIKYNAELLSEYKKNPDVTEKMMQKLLKVILEKAKKDRATYEDIFQKIEKIKAEKNSVITSGDRKKIIELNDKKYSLSFDLHNIYRKIQHLRIRYNAIKTILNRIVENDTQEMINELDTLTSFDNKK